MLLVPPNRRLFTKLWPGFESRVQGLRCLAFGVVVSSHKFETPCRKVRASRRGPSQASRWRCNNIYIYIYTQCIHIYIYIYIHTHYIYLSLYVYIYIYIYYVVRHPGGDASTADCDRVRAVQPRAQHRAQRLW